MARDLGAVVLCALLLSQSQGTRSEVTSVVQSPPPVLQNAVMTAAQSGVQPAAQPAVQPAVLASTLQPVLQPAALAPIVQPAAVQPAVPAPTAQPAAQPAVQPAVPPAVQPALQLVSQANAAHAAVDAAIWANAAAASSTAASTAAASANEASSKAAAVAASLASKEASIGSVVASAAVVPPAPVITPISESYLPQALHIFAGLTFASVIKALCVAGNVLVQLSALPQVKRWEHKGSTGDSDAAPYVSIAFGGCQWCFYGIFAVVVTSRRGFLILVESNILGAFLGAYYVKTFYQNCRNESSFSTLQKYLSAVTSLVLLQVCAVVALPAENALFLTGIVASFCSFMGATAVLVTVPAVLRTKDSSSIPGTYAIANMGAALVWSLCGYILGDPMVMMPNIFATFCSGASLCLKVLYPSPPSKDDALAMLAMEFGMDENFSSTALYDKHDKSCRTELKSLHSYISAPSELTPMKLTSKGDSNTFAEHGYFTGTGQKLSSIGAPSEDWDGDGTGGTF